jgi:hypothetical protein
MRIISTLIILSACTPATPLVGDTDAGAPDTDAQPSILYLAMSVHLEGWSVKDPAVFEKVIKDIDNNITVYDAYGARVTWESKELTAASLENDDTALQLIDESEHEVSIHADLGFDPVGDRTQEEFTTDLTQMHDDLAQLLGRDPNNVSGICSDLDWVTAALASGFDAVSGTVEYCLKSLDVVPADVAACQAPNECHDGYPAGLAESMHPWRTSDGGTWTTPDPEGELVIIPAATGITCLDEKLTEESVTGCQMSTSDIDLYFDILDEALTLLEPDQLNVLKGTYSHGKPLDVDLQEQWLERLQPYIDAGSVEWKTIAELVEMTE